MFSSNKGVSYPLTSALDISTDSQASCTVHIYRRQGNLFCIVGSLLEIDVSILLGRFL
jgi:hypothetical protein